VGKRTVSVAAHLSRFLEDPKEFPENWKSDFIESVRKERSDRVSKVEELVNSYENKLGELHHKTSFIGQNFT